jgi:hypothetical protein
MIDTEQYQDESPVSQTCRRCQRPVRFRSQEDGECWPDCNDQQLDRIRQRDAQRQLHRDTAAMLRRFGWPERAAVHDQLAEGRW